MLRVIMSQKVADVSQVLAASIIRDVTQHPDDEDSEHL
jgi:hypothetical protein